MKMNYIKTADHYYLAVRPQTNEYHSVHKEGCPFMPDNSGRIYLGIFASGDDAGAESRKVFPRSCQCRFCSDSHESQTDSSSEINISALLPTMEQLSACENQAMVYLQN
jgi:hypothetical protein